MPAQKIKEFKMKRLMLPLIIIGVLFFSSVGFAGDKIYGDFRHVKFVDNYDGDTITVNIMYAHPIIGQEIPIRVAGVDTPEIRGKCPKEKLMAYEAKKFVKEMCENGKKIVLRNARRDKYFRILAIVEVDFVNVADELIKAGLGRPYGGETRKSWCE
jgi:endonuclease YncB( thermonuclease family)